MLDLTTKEVKIVEAAGRRRFPKWIIWLPGVLGAAGGGIVVLTSLLEKPSADLNGVAYGLILGGVLIFMSGMTATIQSLTSLIAKLRDQVELRP